MIAQSATWRRSSIGRPRKRSLLHSRISTALCSSSSRTGQLREYASRGNNGVKSRSTGGWEANWANKYPESALLSAVCRMGNVLDSCHGGFNLPCGSEFRARDAGNDANGSLHSGVAPASKSDPSKRAVSDWRDFGDQDDTGLYLDETTMHQGPLTDDDETGPCHRPTLAGRCSRCFHCWRICRSCLKRACVLKTCSSCGEETEARIFPRGGRDDGGGWVVATWPILDTGGAGRLPTEATTGQLSGSTFTFIGFRSATARERGCWQGGDGARGDKG